MENWKALPFAEDLYEISELGNFRAKRKIDRSGKLRAQRDLLQSETEDGYLKVSLFINGKGFKRFVHRLVYETFCGPIPSGMEINHIDGNKRNNFPTNLELATRQSNMDHARDVLKKNFASYGNARMSEEKQKQIHDLRAQGQTFKQIAKSVGFSPAQVWNVVHGISWKINP